MVACEGGGLLWSRPSSSLLIHTRKGRERESECIFLKNKVVSVNLKVVGPGSLVAARVSLVVLVVAGRRLWFVSWEEESFFDNEKTHLGEEEENERARESEAQE